MSYRVIGFFTDLQDNDHAYHEGDLFPRDGLTVTDERIAELSGNKNLQGRPLIEEVPDEPKEAPRPKRRKKEDAD